MLFTNAVEILDERPNLGCGAVGSVLATMGTALPETTIPLVAIATSLLAGSSGAISIGAVIGVSFLTTPGMPVVGSRLWASCCAARPRSCCSPRAGRSWAPTFWSGASPTPASCREPAAVPENERVRASRVTTPLRSRIYRRLSLVVRSALGLALAWLLVTGQVVGFLIVGLFFALSFAYRLREDRLPNAFDLFLALAALLNAFGFAFNPYTRLWPYDEAAYALTVFSLTLALFFLFYKDQVPERGALATAVFTFGMATGALWELVEWTAGLVLGVRVNSGLDDAMTDLLANGAGALVATFVALAVLGSRGEQSA